MVEELRDKARELLKNKRSDVIIGYKRASDGVSAMPAFIINEKEIDTLVFDIYCVYNLSGYIKDFPGKKVAFVAKACDAVSIAVLCGENQAKREDLFIIGVECRGVIDDKRSLSGGTEGQETGFAEKCRNCKSAAPLLYDHLLKGGDMTKKDRERNDEDDYVSIRKMEARSPAERLKFWQDEFSRCIRCYACRQVCPFCYCPTCVADQTMPAWFSKAADLLGNFSWNVTRAIHLAGRCTGCGECERACPMGIPLMDLNKKIAKDVKELFNYEAGFNAEQKPLFSSFDKSDPEDFIR
ncbi:MAG: 4Fe-4S dicluster domain-containing protein [Candidatus Omnitrophota bacterium]|nr:4Fe-4S dicluster domain-containing protein [Candidatus Omnitrophota bacterium]